MVDLSGREFPLALPLTLIHPAFMVTIVFMIMVILATIMLVITLMIVTGSAKAVSVRCAEYLGYRGGAERSYSPKIRSLLHTS